MIRPATLQDLPRILEVGKRLAELYPLKADDYKMRQLLTEAISSRGNFAMVDEFDGKICAVLIGLVGDNLWAQRRFANIVLWWSNTAGSGAALLRKFKVWVVSRRAIKVAGLCPDIDLDDRVHSLLQRVGFKRSGGAYLLIN